LFYEKAFSLLKQNGFLFFITSNKFLSQGYGLLLRQAFLKQKILTIINFNFNVFESATVSTCIFALQKTHAEHNDIKIIDIQTIKDANKFRDLEYSKIDQFAFNNIEDNNFRINLTNQKIKVLEKIKHNTVRVEDIMSVNYGLRPTGEKLGKKKDYFIHTKNPDKKFKKYFEGKDMGKWLIVSHRFIDYQPEVMYNAMFPELFESPKLVGIITVGDINGLRFIFDDKKYYCNHSVAVLNFWHLFKDIDNKTIKHNISNEKILLSKSYNYQLLQGILNSRLIKYYVKELLHDGLHFYPNHIKSLPIVKIDNASRVIADKITALVSQILAEKGLNAQADTSKLEAEVDAAVYKLYGLTEDEIAVVEG
jgi:hypothetical protein